MQAGWRAAALTSLMVLLSEAHASEFAAELIECVPAPGQFINDPSFNDPYEALGPPAGNGGTSGAGNVSLMSLGGFGGSIVLRFDHTVLDDPNNYLGLDFIVFGNAFWASGDPQRRFAELGHVEVMRDVNGDGLAGTSPQERWYLIPGSLLADGNSYRLQTWDEVPGDPYPPANIGWFPWFGEWPYLPEGPCVIPLDEFGRYTTGAYELPAPYDPNDPSGWSAIVPNPNLLDGDPNNDDVEGLYGYADYSPTLRLGDLDADAAVEDPNIAPEEFFTVPDNPFRVGITPGSGGGDAFDIAWAVDPSTWQPANLAGIDFVRITCGIDAIQGVLGEMSPEIDAVGDVRGVFCPGDIDRDADVDLVDLVELRNRLGVADPDVPFSIYGDLVLDGVRGEEARHDERDLVKLRADYLGAVCE